MGKGEGKGEKGEGLMPQRSAVIAAVCAKKWLLS